MTEEHIFITRFLQVVHDDGVLDPKFSFFSDEAWFHLSGYISAQNSTYWSNINQRQDFWSAPSLSEDSFVVCHCCYMNNKTHILEKTVNSEWYVWHFLAPFWEQDKVYSDNSHILNELQQSIQETFTSIEIGEHYTLNIISFWKLLHSLLNLWCCGFSTAKSLKVMFLIWDSFRFYYRIFRPEIYIWFMKSDFRVPRRKERKPC
jgi:hypothetical protein